MAYKVSKQYVSSILLCDLAMLIFLVALRTFHMHKGTYPFTISCMRTHQPNVGSPPPQVLIKSLIFTEAFL